MRDFHVAFQEASFNVQKQELEYLCILFLKWLKEGSIDIFCHQFAFCLALHKFHWNSFVGGCVIALYNTASEIHGHHLSFSEMSTKDSTQFPSKLLSPRQKNQNQPFWDMIILSQEPFELPVGLQFSPFDLNSATLWHQFRLPIRLNCLLNPDQKGLELCSSGWESSSQGIVCSTPMLLLHVSIWRFINLHRDLEVQDEAQAKVDVDLVYTSNAV